jgi:tetratricopeptide (TPR) repeat protein
VLCGKGGTLRQAALVIVARAAARWTLLLPKEVVSMTAYVETRPPAVAECDPAMATRPRAARLLEDAIFYTLLSLIALAAIPYGTVEEWWESLFQCVVFALAGLWAFEGLTAGKWFVREHRLLTPLVPLLGFVVLQTVPLGREEVAGVTVWRTLSADAYETRLVAFRFLTLLLVAAMLLRYTSSRRRLGALVYTVIGVGVSSALFGLARDALHRDGDGEGFILPYLHPLVGYAQFINSNHFALLMEMCMGLLLGLAARGVGVQRRRRVQLFVCLSTAALLWAALLRSASRGGILAAVGQMIFLVLLWGVAAFPRQMPDDVKVAVMRRRRVPRLLARAAVTLCLMFALGLTAVWIGGGRLVRKIENLRGQVGAQGAGNRTYPRRSAIWWATWQMIKEHPLAGTGFGGYWLAIPRYFDASGSASLEQAHNDYLELLASGGLIAVAAALLFGGLFIKRARECLRSGDPFRRSACFGALAGLFGVALHSFVDFGLHITANALVFVALIVIATAHVRPDVRVRPTRWSFRDGSPRTRWARAAVVVLCLLCCPALMLATARAGLSRWYSMSRGREYSLRSAEQAVRFSPHDPAARYFRAELLSANLRKGEVSEEFGRAVALRPRAYFLWIRLGLAREAGGDSPGALAAFQEAVRLAPFYAEPRWIHGGALLRAGERERAFAEVSRAVASDPVFPPQTLEMLWEAAGGDAGAMVQGISPQSTAARDALARFFVDHGATNAAAALIRQAGNDADGERRVITLDLISAKKFGEAYELWSSGRAAGADTGGGGGAGSVTDGGFEEEINPHEFGFGWCVATGSRGLSVSSDTEGARAGARSLRLDFNGEVPMQSALISQLVLVEADTHYRLSFTARAKEMKTAAPPVLMLTDASSGQWLARPLPMPGGTTEWQDYAVEFKTASTTGAVLIAIQGQQCAEPPCFALGRLWLDDFSLRKLTISKTALLSSRANSSSPGGRVSVSYSLLRYDSSTSTVLRCPQRGRALC